MKQGPGRPRGVHLVGSVPLRDAEEVFATADELLGRRLLRISDGETGERSSWIHWQSAVFQRHPSFERATPADPADYSAGTCVRLRPETSPSRLSFAELGYARVALASYAAFARAKRAGRLSAHLRFQVSLPTPLAPVVWFVQPDDRAAVEPAYEAALLAEVERIAAVVPPAELAIQWDVAVEFALLEGLREAHFETVEAGVVERLTRLGNRVPRGVELGYHLCYGDAGHRHFKEPEDASKLVRIANALAAGLARPLGWIHLPVPRDRDDEAYFAPLAGLALPPRTRLYLGLVHRTDGVEGAARRVAAARRFVADFGVGTECGLGRRPPETIAELLRLHARVADPV
jgi:hypothetical protein